MENKQKGRPPKNEKIVRRDHFSVWVTKDEKQQINELIEKSGLSASQFFLTQVLSTPIKRPQKKTLPPKTAETILTLEKLSGILSLAVLKASSADILSQRWQHSSRNVRLLSELITRWAFEDFEIRGFHKTLSDTSDWMKQLYTYLEKVLAGENKAAILKKTASIYHSCTALLAKYENYYLETQPEQKLAGLENGQPLPTDKVHEIIEQLIQQLLNQRKS